MPRDFLLSWRNEFALDIGCLGRRYWRNTLAEFLRLPPRMDSLTIHSHIALIYDGFAAACLGLRRPQSTARVRNDLAVCGVSAWGCSRHDQLPWETPGTFILSRRASPSASCAAMIAVFAVLAYAKRIMACSGRLALAPESSIKRARAAGASACHQPRVVSLSCVPGYTTQCGGCLCGKSLELGP